MFIYSIGNNANGQLDIPSVNDNFQAVAAGNNHGIGLKLDSSIVAWGLNTNGQGSPPPTNTGFTMIDAGNSHNLALRSDGSIEAWGLNTDGQLNIPAPNSNFMAVSAGAYHSIGLKTDGSIVVWGDNFLGQGVPPSSNSNFIAISAGGGHNLALKNDGSIVAWGHNSYGQATAPSPNTNFTAISAGLFHSLGLKNDGSIIGWGSDLFGAVSGIPSPNIDFSAISAGNNLSVALKNRGSLKSWGSNSNGQTDTPLYPNGYFSEISAGRDFVFALKSLGDVRSSVFDDFDFPSGIWLGETASAWNGTPTYAASHITMNPPNLSVGRLTSTFAMNDSNFSIDISGARAWTSPATYNGSNARAWVGIYQSGVATQLVTDPNPTGYGKTHKLWFGIPTNRQSFAFDKNTHYVCDLNELFNWQNATVGSRSFSLNFRRVNDTIEIYDNINGSGIPWRTFTIERPSEPLLFEFVEMDWSSWGHSYTNYEFFDYKQTGSVKVVDDITNFIHGSDYSNNQMSFTIRGVVQIDNESSLAINGSNYVNHQSSFVINGLLPKPALFCPILDPTASIQITDALIGVYQSRIDAVINQLGKSVLLEFDPNVVRCPNCLFDNIRHRSRGIYRVGGPRPFVRGRECPYCKGRGFLETPVEKCIRCLIRWNAKDALDYGISVERGKNIVRFKTHLYNFDELVRARFAISNYAIQRIVQLRVKLIKEPIITGLREDRYCISFWESI